MTDAAGFIGMIGIIQNSLLPATSMKNGNSAIT